MRSEIRDRPAFANVRVELEAGDRIVAEADAMASMSADIELSPRFAGGLMRALLRRVLGGESLFVNEFTTRGHGEVVLTQPFPGDIECIDLHDTALFLQPGSFLGCESHVRLGLSWAGFASLIGGEGLFRLRVSGRGRVWFGAYGGIYAEDIAQEMIVDSGHLVAYEPSISLRAGLAGGPISSIFNGEGLVTRVRGPGRIFLQTRSVEGLSAWTNAHLF